MSVRRSTNGRYCDSPPRSPRHYDKFTYSLKRRPEGDSESGCAPCSPRSAPRAGTYEAVIAGVAPLMLNKDGFAVAEDGSVQCRYVSAPRYSAPSIAMVPVPMAVMSRPIYDHAVLTSPSKSTEIAPIPLSLGVSEIVPSTEVEAWRRLLMVAGRDFTEEEITMLNWETLAELLAHYKIVNPIDVARIQLQWKRRQGQLPSDAAGPLPITDAEGFTYVSSPMLVRYPNRGSPNRTFASEERRPTSPRRGTESPSRYTPPLKTKQATYNHVNAKVDSGRRTPTRNRSPARLTPSRPSGSRN
jgi:hypothetical protein